MDQNKNSLWVSTIPRNLNNTIPIPTSCYPGLFFRGDNQIYHQTNERQGGNLLLGPSCTNSMFMGVFYPKLRGRPAKWESTFPSWIRPVFSFSFCREWHSMKTCLVYRDPYMNSRNPYVPIQLGKQGYDYGGPYYPVSTRWYYPVYIIKIQYSKPWLTWATKRKRHYFPLYWWFNRDPHHGLLYSLYIYIYVNING